MRILSGKMLVLAVVLALAAYGAVRMFGGGPSLVMANGAEVSGKAIRQPVTVQPLAVTMGRDVVFTLRIADAGGAPVKRILLRGGYWPDPPKITVFTSTGQTLHSGVFKYG